MTIKTLKMVRFGPYIKETVVDFEQFTGKVFLVSGDTGAGKTTLVNLLMRFYEVNEGTIRVEGQPQEKRPPPQPGFGEGR